MSTQIQDIDNVTITRYSRGMGKGLGYQVTWLGKDNSINYNPSDESYTMHKWVSFDSEEDALMFSILIRKAIKR